MRIQPEENIAGNGGMFEDQFVHLSDDPMEEGPIWNGM